MIFTSQHGTKEKFVILAKNKFLASSSTKATSQREKKEISVGMIHEMKVHKIA